MATPAPGVDAEPDANAKIADLMKELILMDSRLSHRNRQLLAAIARWAADSPIDAGRVAPPPAKPRKPGVDAQRTLPENGTAT